MQFLQVKVLQTNIGLKASTKKLIFLKGLSIGAIKEHPKEVHKRLGGTTAKLAKIASGSPYAES